MALELMVERTGTVAVLRGRGAFSITDWAAAIAALSVHSVGPLTRIIFDRRGSAVLDRAEQAWAMASVVGEKLPQGCIARWAVLVDGPLVHFGVARMFTASLEALGCDAAVFRDPGSAIVWLMDGDESLADDVLGGAAAGWERRARRLGAGLGQIRREEAV